MAKNSRQHKVVNQLKEIISNLASEHEVLWKNTTALIGVVHRKDAEKDQLEQIKISVLEDQMPRFDDDDDSDLS